MRNTLRKTWQRGRSLMPVQGFAFSRPLVVLQSDDWGRVGLRDREGWEQARQLVPNLGERAYDYYSLETAEDVAAIASVLGRHRDSTGQSACLGMNFVLANVDLTKVVADGFRHIHLRPLTAGLPDAWKRAGLFEAYREGIEAGVFSPALHGTTHFCQPAVERSLTDPGERGSLLRRFWTAGLPYIHWRMPWIGFEYWDPEQPEELRFLSAETQETLIGRTTEIFIEFFSKPPRSACAPGYRANHATQRAWAERGIRVAQNGPGNDMPPHFDRNGILQLYRAIDFEPAVEQQFSIAACLRKAEDCFALGLPAVVSIHSLNFHSTIRDFRTRTLEVLDEFLAALESRHRDLLYILDEDVYALVEEGKLESAHSTVRVAVTKRMFGTGSALRRGA
ncbi:MAG: hypothetical protein WB562_18510 [Candidatus Sulfotelmatobacter sp.]